MKQRIGYKKVYHDINIEQRLKDKQCPSCGKPKTEWTRRKDWTCCSQTCTEAYYQNLITYSWAELRIKAFERDNYQCKRCSNRHEATDLVGDHVKPIALGGEEFDLTNVQTLCIICNKVKTKGDARKIAAWRRIRRYLRRKRLKWTLQNSNSRNA